MNLSLIVAVAENGVIGRDEGLPWRLSADLQRFKKLTMGHAIIMGRKTYSSIGRLLPGRRTVVISRNPSLAIDGGDVASTLLMGLQLVADDEEAFVIGGRQIYQIALPMVDRIYWTQVHAAVDGDVYFPDVDWDEWYLREETNGKATDRNDFDYSFRVFERVKGRDLRLSDDLDIRR